MDFLTNEYSFKSASGLCDIYAQSASPADYGSVKGVVQITHGMAEHSNRYGRFAVELCKNGYAVFIIYMRPFGARQFRQRRQRARLLR